MFIIRHFQRKLSTILLAFVEEKLHMTAVWMFNVQVGPKGKALQKLGLAEEGLAEVGIIVLCRTYI